MQGASALVHQSSWSHASPPPFVAAAKNGRMALGGGLHLTPKHHSPAIAETPETQEEEEGKKRFAAVVVGSEI